MQWKYIRFKAKDSEIKNDPTILGNISGDFSVNNLKIAPRLNGCVYDFSVDYRPFDTSNIVDIHKYLIKNII